MIPLLRGIVKVIIKRGFQECKCFTSDGPLSFTPSSNWDVIYFLDARDWLNDNFILYIESHYKEQRVNGETYK
jgi:hypothetical protein